MKNKKCNRLIAGLLILAIAGCAGRSERPITTNRAGDKELTCNVLNAEKIDNNNEIQTLELELARVAQSNRGVGIGFGIAGLFIFPLWLGLFALDTKTDSAVRIETTALNQRNSNLDRLLANKNCPL